MWLNYVPCKSRTICNCPWACRTDSKPPRLKKNKPLSAQYAACSQSDNNNRSGVGRHQNVRMVWEDNPGIQVCHLEAWDSSIHKVIGSLGTSKAFRFEVHFPSVLRDFPSSPWREGKCSLRQEEQTSKLVKMLGNTTVLNLLESSERFRRGGGRKCQPSVFA